jgi:hypothetical protein
MQIQVEFWHLVGLAGGVIGAYAAIAKLLLMQVTKGIDNKFTVVTNAIGVLSKQGERYGDDLLRLERELARFRLEAEQRFTLREDHNQAIASIRIGLDNMSLRFETALRKRGQINE